MSDPTIQDLVDHLAGGPRTDMSNLNDAVSKALDASADPEEEALQLLVWLQARYDWSGVMFTRKDVEAQVERDLTDEEWEQVTATHVWRDMGSIILEGGGWEPVLMAIDEADIEYGDE